MSARDEAVDRLVAWAAWQCPWTPSCDALRKPCTQERDNAVEGLYCPRADARVVVGGCPTDPPNPKAED